MIWNVPPNRHLKFLETGSITKMNNGWTVIIEEDPKTGELILPIPDDLLVQMEWGEGDELVWEETEMWESHGEYPGYTLRKRYENESRD
jgi:hypothetical protein